MPLLRRLPLLLLALTLPLRAADDAAPANPPDKLPTLQEARATAARALAALLTDDAEGFENTLDLSDYSTRYNADLFLRRTRARRTFLLVAQARFNDKAADADPQPIKLAAVNAVDKSLQTAQVWVDETRSKALIFPDAPESAPLLLARDGGEWSFDPDCLLPTQRRFPAAQRLRAEADAYETLARELAAGKIPTPAAALARFTALRSANDDTPPLARPPATQPAPAAAAAEKPAGYDSPRHALATYLNAVRSRDERAAREAVASPDTDEARALEALFLRLASARAIRGAAFDAFGEVALPLDPLDSADDKNLTPAINSTTWMPLYFRNGVARMTLALGSLELTFFFARVGEEWKIDPAPTLAINKIDPMPATTLSIMRVKALAAFDFAQQIRDKKFATWRDARSARRSTD